MKKSIEMANPDSCLNKAGDDEMIFVLRGKDPCFAATVMYWCRMRVMAGIDEPDSEKITEAMADAMDVQCDQFRESIDRFQAGAAKSRESREAGPGGWIGDLIDRMKEQHARASEPKKTDEPEPDKTAA